MSDASRFVWTALLLPAPLSVETVRQAVQALAGVSGQPRLVLEVVGRGGTLTWRLGTRRDETAKVLRCLRSYLPGLRTDVNIPVAQSAEVALATQLRAPGSRRVSLDTRSTASVARGVLGGLAQARQSEDVRLQLVLGPRFAPRRAVAQDISASERRDFSTKLAEHRFGCSLRLSATAASPERARSLVSGVAGMLRSLEAPGVRLHLHRVGARVVAEARSPFLWPLELGVSEVAALLGWPVSDDPDAELPGVPSRHPKLLPVAPNIPVRGRVLGVSTTDSTRAIALSPSDSLRHLHVLGPTGVGKSTLLGQLALQDMAAGHGVVVIDPKGDLVKDLLARVPAHRLGDVVVLDPTETSVVGINGLVPPQHRSGPSRWSADLAADTLLGVFHSLYADSWGPRTQDILHACLLTLARRGDGSLAMVPLLLTNPGFRRSVVGRAAKADPMGLGSFWAWFEGISEAERGVAIAPLMNKLRPISLRPGLRAVFGQRRPKFQLAHVFTERKILLVSLSRGVLGAEAAQLLGSVMVALLWQAALGRAAVAASQRRPVSIIIDEVHDHIRSSGDLADVLVQARGLGVGFTLAHQHLGQLPTSLREAVMANARSRLTFQLSPSDARTVAATTHGQLEAVDFQTLSAFQAYAALLTGGSPSPWCSVATQPLPHPERPGAARELRARSWATYGQPLDEVERDLMALMNGDGGSNGSGNSDVSADEPLGRRRVGGRP